MGLYDTVMHSSRKQMDHDSAWYGDPIDELFDEIVSEMSGNKPVRINHMRWLCDAARPMKAGTLLIIGGDPGSNKSTLALDMLMAAVDDGHTASYLPLESTRALHTRRMLAKIAASWKPLNDCSEDPNAAARSVSMAEANIDALRKYSTCLAQNIQLPDKDGEIMDADVDWVVGWVTKEADAGKRLIIVDPMAGINFMNDRARWENEELLIRYMNAVAHKSGATICLVCHSTKKREGKIMSMSDLQGSASISRFADCVLMLEKHDMKEREVMQDDGDFELKDYNRTLWIAKARHAKGGAAIAYLFGQDRMGSPIGPNFIEIGPIKPKSKD